MKQSNKFLCKCGHEEHEEDIHSIIGNDGNIYDLCDSCFSTATNLVYIDSEGWKEIYISTDYTIHLLIGLFLFACITSLTCN